MMKAFILRICALCFLQITDYSCADHFLDAELMISTTTKDIIFVLNAENAGKNKWKLHLAPTSDGEDKLILDIEGDECDTKEKSLSFCKPGSFFCCTIPNPFDEHRLKSTSSGTLPSLSDTKPYASSWSKLELSGFLFRNILRSRPFKTTFLVLKWDTPGALGLTAYPERPERHGDNWEPLPPMNFGFYLTVAIGHSMLYIVVKSAEREYQSELQVVSFQFGRLISVISKTIYSAIVKLLGKIHNRNTFDCTSVPHDVLPDIKLSKEKGERGLKLTSQEYVHEISKEKDNTSQKKCILALEGAEDDGIWTIGATILKRHPMLLQSSGKDKGLLFTSTTTLQD